MVKLVISKVRPGKRTTGKNPVSKARVRNQSGRLMDVFTIDASSPTFEGDLTQVFRENVASARRENKRLFGSPDGLVRAARRRKIGSNAVRQK